MRYVVKYMEPRKAFVEADSAEEARELWDAGYEEADMPDGPSTFVSAEAHGGDTPEEDE